MSFNRLLPTMKAALRTVLGDAARRRGNSPLKPGFRPRLESLEDRTLLSVTLVNTPTWVEQGPGPITNAGGVELNHNTLADVGDVDTGAIEAIAVDPNDKNHVFVGTVNGGIWQTTNVSTASPIWTTTTDQMPSLAISAIAFSPTNSNIVYAGTGSFSSMLREGGAAVGLYRTLDGGNSWTNIGFDTFNGMNIRSVIPTTLNSGNTVFVATTNSRSNATGTGGIYRSDNSGNTWIRLSGANGLPDAPVSHLVSFTSNINGATGFYTAVVGSQRGIFRSMDGGVSWQSITNNIETIVASAIRIELSVSAAGHQPVYAGLLGGDGRLLNVFRSVEGTDGRDNNFSGSPDEPREATWRAIAAIPPDLGDQGDTHFSILADKDVDDVVYVGGTGANADSLAPLREFGALFRGNSSSRTWAAISLPGAGSTAPHPDSRDMVFTGNDILEADDGGIYRLVNPRELPSPVPRTIWHSVIGNLRNTELVSVALDNQNNDLRADDIILAGTQDNGAIQRSAAGQWTEVLFGDGMIVQAVDNTTNSVRFFTTQHLGSFSKQADGGDLVAVTGNIKNLSSIRLNSGFDATMPFRTQYQVQATDPQHPQRILVGTGQRLYESIDGGEFFTSLGGVIGGTTASALPVPNLTGLVISMAYGSVVNPEVAYVGTDTGANTGEIFLRTEPEGTDFNGIPVPAPFTRTRFSDVASSDPLVDVTPLDIVVDPQNPFRAFAVTDNAVFRTVAGTNGMDWTPITGNLAQLALPGSGIKLRTIDLFDNNTPLDPADDVVLVGGLGGVFRLLPDTGGPKWSEYGAGLPNVQVTDMEYDERSDTLLVGTLGRSAWTVSDVRSTIARESVLQINGTTGADTITLVRDSNPLLLDVFFNDTATPNMTVQLSVVQRILVNTNTAGDTEADLLEIQSTNGTVSVPHGIRLLGGGVVNDALTVQNSTDTRSITGELSSRGNGVFGFTGLADGLTFSGVGALTILLGSGADNFTVGSTPAATATTVRTSSGADTVVLGGSSVNGIQGPVTIDAGSSPAGTQDFVILQEFEQAGLFSAGITNVGILGTLPRAGPGSGFLSGFGMGATVNFTNTEFVAIIEGPSNDFVTFQFASGPFFTFNLSLDGGINGVTFLGTDGNDRIHISRRVGPSGPEVVARINGQTFVAGYQGGQTVRVLAGQGNDEVIIDASVTTWRAELFGGGGNDRLVGGPLADLLDGGAGNDLLEGGAGDDELIGGPGHDIFDGGAGADRIHADDGSIDLVFADLDDLLIGLDPFDQVVLRRRR